MLESVLLITTKHFALKYMRNWGWDFHDIREAIRGTYKIDQVGKNKFEIYMQKSGFKKIIVIFNNLNNELICISGAEGSKRK